jgi:proteasome beta subunit
LEKTNGVKSGTTTVGIVCGDAVILAAERKASMGYLVASKDEMKIVEILPHLAMTESGMVGDIQALTRYLKAETRLFELTNKKRISVKAAATLLANILYQGRWSFFPYYVQLILAGYDEKGASLFVLAPDGSRLEDKKFFTTGSGSPMAFGVLEALYRKTLTLDECKRVAIKAVKAAVERDIASGGSGIDVAVVDKDGFRMLDGKEVDKILEEIKK